MFAQETAPPATGTAVAGEKKEDVKALVQSSDFLFWSVILAAILFLSAVVFYFVDRWRKMRPDVAADREASLTLSSFRQMYDDGEITESEYRKLRDKMAAKLKGVAPGAPASVAGGGVEPNGHHPGPPVPPPPPHPPSSGTPPDPVS
jgi:hypothetical protein